MIYLDELKHEHVHFYYKYLYKIEYYFTKLSKYGYKYVSESIKTHIHKRRMRTWYIQVM